MVLRHPVLLIALFLLPIGFFVLWLLERPTKWASDWLPNLIAESSGIFIAVVIVGTLVKAREKWEVSSDQRRREERALESRVLAEPRGDVAAAIANAVKPLIDFITATYFHTQGRAWNGQPFNLVLLARDWSAEAMRVQPVTNPIWVQRLINVLEATVAGLTEAREIEVVMVWGLFQDYRPVETISLAHSGFASTAEFLRDWLIHQQRKDLEIALTRRIPRDVEDIAKAYFRLTGSALIREAPADLDAELASVYRDH